MAAAPFLGYLIGSIPTAVWLGRLWGVDLRGDGSGNPGANNARRLGGYTLAILVLLIELTKGLTAALSGLVVGDETGAVLAGLGAVAGNVYNVWHRFAGGKGLGITGGVLLGLWPTAFPFIVVTIAVASALARSTGIGTLVTQALLLVGALVWGQTGLESPWGVADTKLLVLMAAGLCLILVPKHWRDARVRLSSPARP